MFSIKARLLRRIAVAQSHCGAEGEIRRQASVTQNVATNSRLAAASISLRQSDFTATSPLVRDDVPLEAIFEDDWLLVVNKPSGIKHEPYHRFVGGALINRVASHIGHDPFTVHRLDMFTSGVVCFAKHKYVAQALHTQMRQHKILKQYLVLVVGLPQGSFSVDAPISRDPQHAFARRTVLPATPAGTDAKSHELDAHPPLLPSAAAAAAGGGGGEGGAPAPGAPSSPLWPASVKKNEPKPAQTSFTVLGRDELSGVSLLLAQPWTGRTHQIRVHLQCAGFPVAGDELYGALPLRWRRDGWHQPGAAGEESPELHSWLSETETLAESVSTWNEGCEGVDDGAETYIAKDPIITRQALHAWQLQLTHPVNGQTLNLCAPPSHDIQRLARACNLTIPEP